MTKKIKLNQLLFFLVSLLIFLQFIIPQFALILNLLTLGLFIIFLLEKFFNNNTFSINIPIIFFLFFILISTIGRFISDQRASGSNEFLLSLGIAGLMYLIISSLNDSQKYLIEIMNSFLLLLTFTGVLQLLAPNLIIQLTHLLHINKNLESSLSFINSKILVGLTHNPAVLGYAISILIMNFMAVILSNKLKISNLFLLSFEILLLFFTGKRGFILFVFIITFYLIIKVYNLSLKTIFLSTLVGLFMVFILVNTEIGIRLVERTLQSEDITTGRMPVYIIMWEDFLKKPIFGNGTYTTNNVIYLFNGHNIYLQVLRENGLTGFIMLLLFFVANLQSSLKLLKGSSKGTFEMKSALLSIGVQLTFIFWGMTGNPLYDIFPLYLYVFYSSIAYSLMRNNKNKEGNI